MPHRHTDETHSNSGDEEPSPGGDDLAETAARWVARRSNPDRWSAETEAELLAWLEADPRHRREFEILQAIHAASERETGSERPFERSSPSHPRRRVWTGLAWVAGIAVTLCGGWAAWQVLDSHRFEASYSTRIGEMSRVDLPDGSQVEIDTNTELRVRFSREARVVHLPHGQAMFTVEPAPDRPFVVRTVAGEVRVVGTTFQVRRDAGQLDVRVAVQEGEVQVVPGANEASVTSLSGGRALSFAFEGSVGAVENTGDDAFGGWRDGWIVFHNRPLEEVVAEMGRYCPQRLRVRTPELGQTRVSGSFSIRDLSEFFSALQRMLPVTVQTSIEDEIVIAPRGE